MTKKMLIDATHKEETRVAIVEDTRLEDFDYETNVRKQLKGNIYLVKVTRVEPSLQAAFVDYGGNRHGFLPFPEIHPDYYRIPIEDREALLAEEQRIAKERAAEAEAIADAEAEKEEKKYKNKRKKTVSKNSNDEDINNDIEDECEIDIKNVEIVGGDSDDEVEENAVKPAFLKRNIKRRYKIQEVIKRGQVMLIQINKEERGNKGAAVSTYISLPGRYCVLMPNSSRGGGVSRKVTNYKDRKRLKKILNEIGVPDGMSVILRTAGVSRTKAEIKRDLDYLLRLWNDTRELTLQSTAPALVHEEGNLIKRSIRDLYRREIEEISIAGEAAYKTAKKFMRMLIPSHAKKVKQYKEDIPIFSKYNVERQIDETYCPNVRLKSGGYLVINPTEALISIDINSGKATKGRHIEETALKTNLEAAEEIARQLRLRDLGGLVVIDFIDMEDYKNNRLVERKLREAMQGDRARIQISRISAFGLLELSRQRLRPSLVESNFIVCPHCVGNGVIRTVESAAVMVLRHVEEQLLQSKELNSLCLELSEEVALYLLNQKRRRLRELEEIHNCKITVEIETGTSHQNFVIYVINSVGGKVKLYSSSEQLIEVDKTSNIKNIDTDNKKRKNTRRKSNKKQNNNNRRKKENTAANLKNVDTNVVSNKEDNTEIEKKSEDVSNDVKPKRKQQNSKKSSKSEDNTSNISKEETKEISKSKKKRSSKKKIEEDKEKKIVEIEISLDETNNNNPDEIAEAQPPKKKKKGWWQKLKE